jgi:DNA-binding transcriptional MocR family regulator
VNALLNAAWKADCAEPSDKLVLVYLADHANRASRAWPHLPTIARQTGLGRSTIIEAVKRLESRGHLTVSRRQGCSNSYTVHPCGDAPTSPVPKPVQPPVVTRPTIGLLPVQPQDQQPNHHGTFRGTGKTVPKFKRATWQLLRDEKNLKERLESEKESCNPDRELIESLKVELRKVRAEMKGQPPPEKLKESF